MTDYHEFTTKDTPVKEREKLGVGDVWINAAKCLRCQDVIRSRNRHDFVTCSCGAISVDGGSWYQKRTGNWADMKDMSEMFADVVTK